MKKCVKACSEKIRQALQKFEECLRYDLLLGTFLHYADKNNSRNIFGPG